jgi:SPP1 family predicted phage head-tail adaptor
MRAVEIEVGGLRHRVTVESYEETQDSAGQPIKRWRTIGRRWASIEHLRGNELFTAQQLFAEANVLVTMRYFPGLETTMRILHLDRVYDILDVDNVGMRNVGYRVLCKTGLTDG